MLLSMRSWLSPTTSPRQCTIFPISLELASCWDLRVAETSGHIAALEESEDDLKMTWAPIVDITRDTRWGCVSQGMGEDTFLAQEIGRILVSAMQESIPVIIIR
ncbi:MAG: Beta-glucosidase BoGH3B [Sodalis sp.]|uniref:glycoside hydrolase family 3 N-terminal domain-containing protein n=1 Tax=Sodalis sp. (in: enterobacteria) TaxID=1898979 RepID=UPI003872CF28|nr:MAG: Beta-glucosidase BoGH3B [Sodalis sp.]